MKHVQANFLHQNNQFLSFLVGTRDMLVVQLMTEAIVLEGNMEKIIVEVCAGTHCTMMGAMNIIDSVHSLDEIQREMGGTFCEVEVRAIPCMDLCRQGIQGPIVRVNGQLIHEAESENVMAAIMARCR